jgi:3-hydroxyisobutyrate dehydrogenase
MQVGFIGVGDQGGPMAEAIAQAGFGLHIWARRDAAAEPYRALGATIYSNPQDLAPAVDCLCLCVIAEMDVREVLFERGVASAMRAGSVIVVHATMSPEGCRNLAAEAAQLGLRFVDAPVSGGRAGAKARTLLVLVGGDKTTIEDISPVLRTYSSVVAHLGAVGAGQTCKILNNLLLNVNMAAAQFVLEFGEALEINRELLRKLLLQGTARSFAVEALDTQIIPGKLGAAIGVKDIGLATDLAASKHIQRESIDLMTKLGLLGRDRLAGGPVA